MRGKQERGPGAAAATDRCWQGCCSAAQSRGCPQASGRPACQQSQPASQPTWALDAAAAARDAAASALEKVCVDRVSGGMFWCIKHRISSPHRICSNNWRRNGRSGRGQDWQAWVGIRLPHEQSRCVTCVCCCSCCCWQTGAKQYWPTLLVIDLIVSCLPGSSADGSWPAQLNLIVSCGLLPAPAGAPHRLALRPRRCLGAVARRHPPLLLLLLPLGGTGAGAACAPGRGQGQQVVAAARVHPARRGQEWGGTAGGVLHTHCLMAN